jgi:hypothetical protein
MMENPMDQHDRRNIFEMNDYREDTGFSAISQVESYWEALRGPRPVPKRSDIDPRGIESALEYTFILERITIGVARIRIAGRHLSDLMGMEVRGMPITSFLIPTHRTQMSDILEDVFQRPSACEIYLTAEIGLGQPGMDARMLLLPLQSDLGDNSRALGCLVSRGEMGTRPRRFDIVGTRMNSLNTTSEKDKLRDSLKKEAPAHAFEEAQSVFQARSPFQAQSPAKPYLRLVKNGQ